MFFLVRVSLGWFQEILLPVHPLLPFTVDGCRAETSASNAKFYGIMMSSDI